MMHFAKCVFDAFKFSCRSIVLNRIGMNVYRKNFWKSTIVNRLRHTYFVEYNLYKNHSRQHAGNERSSLSLGFIATLLSLFGLYNIEDVPEVIMTIKRSILLIQKGEYKRAEQMLHVALRQAQSLQNYDAITYIYDVMANLAFDVKNYSKAEPLFVSVMQRLIATGVKQNDKRIIHISLKMAKLFEAKGDFKKAQSGYMFCMKHLQEYIDKGMEDVDISLLLAMTLDWYSRFLLSQSRYTEAFNHLYKAYEISVKVNGKEHEQTIVLLNDLGTISYIRGNHDQAVEYFTEAAEIGKKMPDMVDLGSIHVNLGNIFMKKGLYEEAKKFCLEGRKLSRMRNDPECLTEANICLDEIKKLLSS